MTKMILVTAGLTFAALLLLSLLIWLTFLIWFPKPLADFYNRAGFPQTVGLSARVYENDPTAENLGVAVERAIAYGDDAALKTYGEIFINHSDFGDFCEQKDQQLIGGSYRAYIRGSLAAAYYHSDNPTQALALLTQDIAYSGGKFPLKSAADYLIQAVENASDADFAADLAVLLEPAFLLSYYAPDAPSALAGCVALYRLYAVAGDTEKTAEYANYYEELKS